MFLSSIAQPVHGDYSRLSLLDVMSMHIGLMVPSDQHDLAVHKAANSDSFSLAYLM